MDTKAELADIDALLESLKGPQKIELYQPPTTSFSDETVFAAMDVISRTLRDNRCDDRDVLNAALAVLHVNTNPIELAENPIKWKSPM